MQTVQLYIYVDDAEGVPVAHRIELFNDEKISVTSSIQNFNDIGKLFTDYSQSFTIPASKHNNAILRHWYESAVGTTNDINPQNVDNAFDHRIKYYGFIEIDTIPFRDGKFSMEKANKKNGFIESYSINFVGNLVQLKDKFKEDKINSLSDANGVNYYDQLNFDYNMTDVSIRTVDTNADVLFPLVGNTRRFEFNTNSPANDISLLSGGIKYTELFPAIPITKILQYIQSAYGLVFSGQFLNSQTFSKLYLFCKNADEMIPVSEMKRINFTSKDSDSTVDLATDVLTVQRIQVLMNEQQGGPQTITAFPDKSVFGLRIYAPVGVVFSLYVYNNGVLFTSFSNLSVTNVNIGYGIVFLTKVGFYSDTYNFTFFINSNETSVTFTSKLDAYHTYFQNNIFYNRYVNAYGSQQVAPFLLSIRSYIPDITVNSFLTGLVKMFNLVIIPKSETEFEFIPVELWYQNGSDIDITEFVEAENIEIGKPKLFKKIDFKHEKSENILNTNYRNFNENQEYGDLFFDNPNSAFTESYEVKTPFEDVMWERTTGTNFLTTTMWNKDRQPYTPKPILMYKNGLTDLGEYRYIIDGLGDYIISQNYLRFSNEIQLAGSDLAYLQTLNWGSENSVWNLTNAPNGLYLQFYSQYINNLYNQRTRVLKVKAHLGTQLLTSIKINDRIALSNKRYLINTMTTDLTTGEVNLELINDFRDAAQNTTYLRYSNIQILEVDNTAQEVQYIIYLNNYDTFDVKLSSDFLSYTVSTDNDTDILLDVTIPANATALDRTDAVFLEYFKGGVSTIINLPVIQYA
jgi:hypothetical protein